MSFNTAFRYLLLSLIFTIVASVELDSDASSVIYLSHSLGSPSKWEPRGQINIRSLRSGTIGSSSIQQDFPFTYEQLKAAAEADEFYHLEAVVKYNGVEKTFLTSTKACLLLESQLSDILTIHVDLQGNIYGISIAASNIQKCSGEVTPFEPIFNSSVLLSYMEVGPIPDVAMYIQKLEQEKLAKERGETKDNRSFIAKYWMYILPLVLVFMMSGAGNAEQGSR
nr:EOG090X0JXR [Macrothrix elegans]